MLFDIHDKKKERSFTQEESQGSDLRGKKKRWETRAEETQDRLTEKICVSSLSQWKLVETAHDQWFSIPLLCYLFTLHCMKEANGCEEKGMKVNGCCHLLLSKQEVLRAVGDSDVRKGVREESKKEEGG